MEDFSCLIKKNRLRYVLKSADVRILVSSRYSKDSSHTHTHTYFCVLLCTSVYTLALPHISAQTQANPHTPTHLHTSIHTHTPPCIPAHAFNLINHMNIQKIEKWQRDRKIEKRKNKSLLRQSAD